MTLTIDGHVFARSDDGYEPARRATVWNARLPDRFPDLIVQAHSVDDVQAAVRHARDHAMRVGIRSGGHSWSASHVRDGGMLLDMSAINDVAVDRGSMSAWVGPGTKGHELCLYLESEGLFFPSGHCKGVAVGGYLLQGGYGWNSRLLGPACESVLGIEVVTADGELIRANAEEHAELYWAARGSGPGFFGVVTRFHLRLYPKPPVVGSSLYVYPASLIDPVYRWAHAIRNDFDPRVEFQMLLSRGFPGLGLDTPHIVIACPVFADTEAEAAEALAILGTCPVVDQAVLAVPFMASDMAGWYDAVMEEYPSGNRYAADNMWTSAPIDDLLPGIHRILETMPPPTSHFLWLGWGTPPERPDMAYSVEDEIYFALYGSWTDPADDEGYATWAEDNMRAMAHLATGIQLADENLGRRPARFVTETNMARLDAARAAYDADGRFHSWLGRP